MENLTLDLRWILNLIARPTLRKLATVKFCDTAGLAFWQHKHRQNSFAILALVALDLVAMPASQAYVEHVLSVCRQP